MKVWVTKYALTKGIFEVEVDTTETPTMVVDRAKYRSYYHKPDWHETRAEAVTRVQIMIAAKRKSIEATLAKLDKLEAELANG